LANVAQIRRNGRWGCEILIPVRVGSLAFFLQVSEILCPGLTKGTQMSGIIHFKFKSSNSYDSVGFEGAFISVSELKVLIAEKKGLSKDATSELLLSDPRTQASALLTATPSSAAVDCGSPHNHLHAHLPEAY